MVKFVNLMQVTVFSLELVLFYSSTLPVACLGLPYEVYIVNVSCCVVPSKVRGTGEPNSLLLQAKLVSIPITPSLVAGLLFVGGLALFMVFQYGRFSWAKWL